MENTNQPPSGVRRELSTDPVKAQGILTSVTKKEKHAARLWQQRWNFLTRVREMQEEEALKMAMIGRRAKYSLEAYGPIVQTARHFPVRPPLPPGQIYDPYKQTVMFLGSVEGDPISYNLPKSRCEVTDDMWARPQQLAVTQFKLDSL
ncbi:hypothetical protein KGM_213617 [Danaus plexippus plexippus]|uniref:Uncharacterized protein n=1 Tax=Danaus plexippus plexippus TaxID=278856 RepID=A0A212F439_DANPL|nr:uncharacterized protein LOC116772583 [Danaus plexippus plexippus]OWR48473.1 hypothetical protein KGM_213617 [Danaus plexippus plexippus]